MQSTAKAELANFKVPKKVFFVDELPRNTMGKVQKNLLRDRFKDSFSSAALRSCRRARERLGGASNSCRHPGQASVTRARSGAHCTARRPARPWFPARAPPIT